jgi:mannosyltransferase
LSSQNAISLDQPKGESRAPNGQTGTRLILSRTLLGCRLILDNHLVVLVVLAVFALELRLWDIGRRSLWLDELTSVAIGALELSDFLVGLSVYANMALYYGTLLVWLRLPGLGHDDGSIRLLSALFGAAAVLLTYALGRRLHSPGVGLASAALLAVNGFHVLMSQEARSYSLLSSLTAISYLTLDRALERKRARDWALYGLATALAFYSHFYTTFIVVAQGILVLSRRSRPALVGLLGSGLLMAVLVMPLAPYFVQQSHGRQLSHLTALTGQQFESFLVDFSGGSHATLALYLLLAVFGIGLKGGARTPSYRCWLLLSWLLVPIVLVVGISFVRPIFKDRYLFAILPALALIAGLGIARLPRFMGVATFGVVGLLSITAMRGDLEVRRDEHWRQAVAYATAQAEPGDGWIFISKWGQNAFEYYGGWRWGRNPDAPYADVLEPLDWREAARTPKYRGLLSMDGLERFAAGHPRIWLVLSHEFDAVEGGDTSAPVREWLTRHGYGATPRQLSSVRVLLYQRRT